MRLGEGVRTGAKLGSLGGVRRDKGKTATASNAKEQVARRR